MELFSTLLYIGLAIVILLFMITVHEFGHWTAGKLLGFKINEFSIGFGKALFKRTSKKTGEVFAIRMIPLGGYCAFEGEDGKVSSPKDKNATDEMGAKNSPMLFNQHAPWKRLIVLFFGAFFNFICAILFAVVLLMIAGYNQVVTIDSMNANSPNAQGNVQNDGIHYLLPGDIVTAVNGEKFTLLNTFSAVVSKYKKGDTTVFSIIREGEQKNVEVHVAEIANTNESSTYIGVGIAVYVVKMQPLGFLQAFAKSFVFCLELAWLVLSLLVGMVTGRISLSGVGGPIATVSVMSESVSNSLLNIFVLIPLISVNLAVFNLLPFPALDGARMVFVAIEWIRGKPVNPLIEGRIHVIGLILLFGLVILADINYLFSAGRFILYSRLRL